MPIYGYVCQNCDHSLDALQKVADAPLTNCPECGTAALKRQLSAPRFRLKGQGWYETDFKSDKQRNLADDKADKAEDKGDGKADAKTDTKPDGKAADKPAAAKADTPKKTESSGKASA